MRSSPSTGLGSGSLRICRALTAHGVQIAPRTFYAWLSRPPSKRALWDTVVTEILAGYYEPDENGRRAPESLYGAEKIWAHLQRQDIPVARCTVERLMPSGKPPPSKIVRKIPLPGNMIHHSTRVAKRQNSWQQVATSRSPSGR